MEIYPSVRGAGERRVHRNFGSQPSEQPADFGAIKSGESSERNARVDPGAGEPLFSVHAFRAARFSSRLFPRPNRLKIDTETHETRVLQGALHLLETVRPVIWCEVSPENAQAVFDILNPSGYELYAAAAPERVPLDRASGDTLALPKPVAAGPAPKVPC